MQRFKAHSTYLEKKEEEKITEKINQKRLADASNKCAKAHNKLEAQIKSIQQGMEEAKVLYHFCIHWPIITKNIKDQIEALDT